MKELNQKIQEKFQQMCKVGKLFRSSLTGDQIWSMYLNSFTKEDDPIYRDPESTSHNCNHCKNFIRRYGSIVTVDVNNNIVTIFDLDYYPGEFKGLVKVANEIKKSSISEVFFETFQELNKLPYESCTANSEQFQLGVSSNPKRYTKEEAEKYGVVKLNQIVIFDHMHLFTPKQFVYNSGKSVESIMGQFRDAKNVFQRSMEEIPLDTLKLVKDLINQGSLLDGTTHLFKIEQIITLKSEYDTLSAHVKDNWCWIKSYNFPLAKFKNELIGVLCSELSEGEELNKACQSWNKRVDPANYMKAKAPITKFQIEEAKKFVEENGYSESFNRRFATLDDIKASEILHVNVGKGEIQTVSMFDNVKATATRHKRSEFEGVEEVTIEKFMKDILPSCTSIEAFLTNPHKENMVSLTTANDKNSKPIFKWSNNFSWTYNGNLAGKSQIKQAVEDAGGKIDGVLGCRLAWNQEGSDNSDLDIWAKEPDGTSIGYSSPYRKDRGGSKTKLSGQLDVDNTNPSGKIAVENIVWSDKSKMKDGVYSIWINQYNAYNSKGFIVEIEFDGEIYTYAYDKPVIGNVKVAEITLFNGVFSIKHLLPETNSVREIYGLESNKFHKVNLVCLSPNHWSDNVGNKHYFFMLDGCKSPTSIRSFHAENLLPEIAEHRKVLEVLGTTNMIEPSNKQLSGLGFNSTIKESLIVKLQGTHKRVIKINF